MDGAPASRPAAEEAYEPPQIPGFDIDAPLGGGGFALVFAATSREGAQRVAIKVARGATHERFAREARALKLLGPPIVPRLLGEGETAKGRPYLVLELFTGPSLGEWLAGLPGRGIAPIDQALKCFVDLCEAVKRVHEVGIVHRDLKPENVFLRDGQLTLIDFGLARFPDEGTSSSESAELTQTGQRLGTAHYMAPEQCLDSREVGFYTDIYSLGVILFELLTARPPFVGDQAQVLQAHVARRAPAPSSMAPVSVELDAVVLRCLAKEPSERFAKVEELLDSLQRARLAPSGAIGATKPIRNETSAPVAKLHWVALLGVRSASPADQIAEIAAREGGKLARIHPGRYLFSFEGEVSREASVRAANRAARSLKEALPADDLFVVHLAKLQIRGSTRTRLIGEDLEHAERWWPDTAQSGLVTTPEAAPFGSSLRTDAVGLELRTRIASNLYGRDELLASLKADAVRAWSTPLPTITTVAGEAGYGKTALLERIAGEISREKNVEILKVQAQSNPQETDAVLRSLLRQFFDLPDGPLTESEVRRCFDQRLSRDTAENAVSAVCLALGVFAESDPRAARVLAVPGMARSAVAKAAGEALRLRAKEHPLAVLLDDAHCADPATLDVLEIATLSEEKAPVWVCATTLPSLWTLRPFWAERSGALIQRALSALDADSARALLLELLQPVDFIPEAVLQRLEEIAHGVPLAMTELVHGLRSNGAIRISEGGAWYVAADELLHESATPVYQRVALRAIETMGPPLRFMAFVCAIIGGELSRDAIGAVQSFEDSSDASVDAGIGLERLVRAGLLRAEGPGKYRFRHPQLLEAVRALIPPSVRRNLHQAALKWETRLPEVARHAEAVGDRERAFNARFELAEEARRGHRYVEADQHYSAAASQQEESDISRRIAVLSGRGRVRYRLQRFSEALEDLRSARRLAESWGRTAEVADLLLEEATVLDWLEDWPGSAARVEAALPLVREQVDERLKIRCDLALGRAHNRREEYRSAVAVLPSVVGTARALGDHETQAIAMVLLGFALAHVDLKASEACFEEVISFCKSNGDDLHLGIAYSNRVMLWIKKGFIERGVEDLRLAVAQARMLGYAQIERFASFNLAEFLYWQRRPSEALPYARRAHELGKRFFSTLPSPLDALLLARITGTLGDFDEAGDHLDWIAQHCSEELLAPGARVLKELMERMRKEHRGSALSGPDWEEWQRLVCKARESCTEDELKEVLSNAVQVAARGGWLERASPWINELRRLQGG